MARVNIPSEVQLLEVKDPSEKTADQVAREQILANLAALGKFRVGDDSLVFEGNKFILPAYLAGNIPGAVKYLQEHEKQQEQTYDFSRTFPFRPWDGANAFQRALKRVFGTDGIGKTIQSFFGSHPPQFRTINISHDQTIQVPWGTVMFSPLSAEFNLGADMDDELGLIFELGVEAPRKYRAHIDALFQIVEDELKNNSIYRGKAITGAEYPQFLDPGLVDKSKVVYSQDVLRQLDANFWTLIEYPDKMRELGIPLKRAILLEGPNGTGKSLAGSLTAQKAVANGWTYIVVRPGVDNLFDALRTAQVYAPAVVWFEDIDTLTKGGSATDMSKLLDALDGVQGKGVEVLAGFTTNFVDKIHKGVLRPGRLDTVIHIGNLDAAGIQTLVRVIVPENLLDNEIDWGAVAKANADYVPAFVREAAERAMRYSVARNHGTVGKITTEDLVDAANGLRAQYDLHNNAHTDVVSDGVGQALLKDVQGLLNNTKIDNRGGDLKLVATLPNGTASARK